MRTIYRLRGLQPGTGESVTLSAEVAPGQAVVASASDGQCTECAADQPFSVIVAISELVELLNAVGGGVYIPADVAAQLTAAVDDLANLTDHDSPIGALRDRVATVCGLWRRITKP